MAMRRFGLLSVGLIAALLQLPGCKQSSDDPVTPVSSGGGDDPAAGEQFGSFAMSLTAGGTYQFDQVSYDVSGNGFHKADTLDVAASSTLSAVVGGIPFGTAYLLKLTAQDTGHKLLPCTGMASFAIQSATTVPVPVTLNCREASQGVPVPAWAKGLLAALLLALGMHLVRRVPPSEASG